MGNELRLVRPVREFRFRLRGCQRPPLTATLKRCLCRLKGLIQFMRRRRNRPCIPREYGEVGLTLATRMLNREAASRPA
jgi:hypothetical protein